MTSILCQHSQAPTSRLAFSWEIIVSAKVHVQWLNMHRAKIHLKVPNGENNEETALFNSKLYLIINRAKWRKGICLWADISLPHCLATDV